MLTSGVVIRLSDGSCVGEYASMCWLRMWWLYCHEYGFAKLSSALRILAHEGADWEALSSAQSGSADALLQSFGDLRDFSVSISPKPSYTWPFWLVSACETRQALQCFSTESLTLATWHAQRNPGLVPALHRRYAERGATGRPQLVFVIKGVLSDLRKRL